MTREKLVHMFPAQGHKPWTQDHKIKSGLPSTEPMPSFDPDFDKANAVIFFFCSKACLLSSISPSSVCRER